MPKEEQDAIDAAKHKALIAFGESADHLKVAGVEHVVAEDRWVVSLSGSDGMYDVELGFRPRRFEDIQDEAYERLRFTHCELMSRFRG